MTDMAPSKWNILRSLKGGKSPTDGLKKDLEGVNERKSFSSKIATVFSAKSKDRLGQSSRLLELPYELQDRIIGCLSKIDLWSFRCVCYQLDEVLSGLLFEEISINCTQAGSHKTGALLRQLGTGKARPCRITKTLHIINLVPFTHPSQSYWEEVNMDENQRPIQQSFIFPALKGLRNLDTVHWRLKVSDPYSSMCDALATLPHLHNIYIHFDRWTPHAKFPFDKFHTLNLTGLHIESGDYLQPITSEVIPPLRKAVLSFPNLKEFSFTPPPIHTPQRITLDDIFIGSAMTPAAAELSLTSLRLSSPFLSTEMHTWRMLRTLTSLDIPNVEPHSSGRLWKFLGKQGLQLQFVKVHNISFELFDYLLTYSGLHQLVIRQAQIACSGLKGALLSRLYCDVLPLHRHSLTKFQLDLTKSGRLPDWGITEDQLSSLLQCTLLRDVQLPFLYDEDDVKMFIALVSHLSPLPYKTAILNPFVHPIEQETLITSFSHLPRLGALNIVPVFMEDSGSPADRIRSERDKGNSLRWAICDMVINDPASFRFALQLLNFEFLIQNYGVQGEGPVYRFEIVTTLDDFSSCEG